MKNDGRLVFVDELSRGEQRLVARLHIAIGKMINFSAASFITLFSFGASENRRLDISFQ